MAFRLFFILLFIQVFTNISAQVKVCVRNERGEITPGQEFRIHFCDDPKVYYKGRTDNLGCFDLNPSRSSGCLEFYTPGYQKVRRTFQNNSKVPISIELKSSIPVKDIIISTKNNEEHKKLKRDTIDILNGRINNLESEVVSLKIKLQNANKEIQMLRQQIIDISKQNKVNNEATRVLLEEQNREIQRYKMDSIQNEKEQQEKDRDIAISKKKNISLDSIIQELTWENEQLRKVKETDEIASNYLRIAEEDYPISNGQVKLKIWEYPNPNSNSVSLTSLAKDKAFFERLCKLLARYPSYRYELQIKLYSSHSPDSYLNNSRLDVIENTYLNCVKSIENLKWPKEILEDPRDRVEFILIIKGKA